MIEALCELVVRYPLSSQRNKYETHEYSFLVLCVTLRWYRYSFVEYIIHIHVPGSSYHFECIVCIVCVAVCGYVAVSVCVCVRACRRASSVCQSSRNRCQLFSWKNGSNSQTFAKRKTRIKCFQSALALFWHWHWHLYQRMYAALLASVCFQAHQNCMRNSMRLHKSRYM